MLIKTRSTVLFGLLLTLSLPSHALLISHHGYTLDTDTDANIVTGGGYEWLRWDVTQNMSIDTALSTVATSYAGGGWSLASNVNMSQLLNDFAFCDFTFDALENTDQSCNDPFTAAELGSDPQRRFVALFGNTWLDFTGDDGTTSDNDMELASAFFGHDLDNDGAYNRVVVLDDYVNDLNSLNENSGATHLYTGSSFTSSHSLTNTGVALVRESAVNAVPTPFTLSLFGIGLLGLWCSRRRQAGSRRLSIETPPLMTSGYPISLTRQDSTGFFGHWEAKKERSGMIVWRTRWL